MVRDDDRSAPVTGGASSNGDAGTWSRVGPAEAARLPLSSVLASLSTDAGGLTEGEARRHLSECGPNALTGQRARSIDTLGRQPKNPLLVLLGATAAVSIGVGKGVVVAIGQRTALGSIARWLVADPPITAFQRGLRDTKGSLSLPSWTTDFPGAMGKRPA